MHFSRLRSFSVPSFALFLLMLGGFVTHLTHGEYLFAMMPVVYGAGLYFLMKESLPELSVRQPAPASV